MCPYGGNQTQHMLNEIMLKLFRFGSFSVMNKGYVSHNGHSYQRDSLVGSVWPHFDNHNHRNKSVLMDHSARPQGYSLFTWALVQNKITKYSLSSLEMYRLWYIYIRFLMALKSRYLKSVNYKILTWHAYIILSHTNCIFIVFLFIKI